MLTLDLRRDYLGRRPADFRRRMQTMASARAWPAFLLLAGAMSACTSATDRFNDGLALQSQGRYIEAVYRYAEAVEKDRELVSARDAMMAAGDTALMYGMQESARLERQGDPVAAAGEYRSVDRMLARIRQVGQRLDPPLDYSEKRRAIFDTAIDWQMERGHEAVEEGRWEDARAHFQGARGDYLPSRDQVEASLDAETSLLLDWAAIELEDQRPRFAYELADQALAVRPSPARQTVLSVRDVQEEALEQGTIVLAVVPVMADPSVREWLGGEFEVQLDSDLGLDHWSRPPLFVQMADPLVLRSELRGLLRGQATQSPLVVGRALDMIGADLGVLIRVSGIDVIEQDVRRDSHQAVIPRNVRQGARRTTVMDTVTYATVRGTLRYNVSSEILLVDPSGREVNRFTASSTQSGPFQRGEFDGDPNQLSLDGDLARFFDPSVIGQQMASIEGAVLEELAVAIAVGTYDQVLAAVR
jgi:tetratricopeptide (TPR) repeat protein